ncbi:MAG: hypothetical protein WCF17_08425 [Terracidiphilus sp.]
MEDLNDIVNDVNPRKDRCKGLVDSQKSGSFLTLTINSKVTRALREGNRRMAADSTVLL